jgi:hypothetical protein
MSVDKIVSAIDAEIALIQKARELLVGIGKGQPKNTKRVIKGRRGGKRTLSAEARARIAEAQRKRWAKQKKEAK